MQVSVEEANLVSTKVPKVGGTLATLGTTLVGCQDKASSGMYPWCPHKV